MALISVLLPYRDAAATVADAVGSILAQQQVELELIAIDDGSRDGGPAWMAAAAARDARIRPIASGGVGVARALRVGLAAARGAWIARMDADDVCAPTRLARQRAAMAAAPRLGAVGTQVRAVGFGGGEVGPGLHRYVAWQNRLLTPAEHAHERLIESPLCHPSVLLRREALDAVGGWRDIDGPEDYDLWLRLHAAGWQLAKVDAVLLDWRHAPGRATFADPRCATARLLATKAPFVADELRARGLPFLIWGAGPGGRRLARALEAHALCPDAFIDIDPRKLGQRVRGAPVIGHATLPADRTIVAAVGKYGARELIRAHLATLGAGEARLVLCA